MPTIQVQFNAAQAGHERREAPEFYVNDAAEEAWQEAHQAELAEAMAKAITVGVDKYDLGEKLAELDNEDLFQLMHLALAGKADELVAAVKRHTLHAIECAAELQAIEDAEDGGFEAYCRKQAAERADS
jgi:hypothetical protein